MLLQLLRGAERPLPLDLLRLEERLVVDGAGEVVRAYVAFRILVTVALTNFSRQASSAGHPVFNLKL